MKTKNKLYHYSAEVTRVVDGDTVDAFVDLGFDMHSKQRVRLFGINTPECRTRDKEEKKRGLAAKARLKEMLSEEKNKCVIKTRLDKKGKFGRVLGVLYVNDKDLNTQLVKEGHAKKYYGGSR
jgi:micrococcal nuclease|tara:strand:- start:3327 stop:3695 length:369 start_codon:yes stop_codon:yes gene_type:complete